jgi:hypothetical protein
VEGFTGGQGSIVYLVSTAQAVRASGLGFVFSDGHGIMAFTEFYGDLAHLDQVDWPLMRSIYWADINDDLDRKRRRQAEFLVHKRFPVELIQSIGVIDPIKKQEAETLLAEFGFTMPVAIQRGWYY